MEEVLESVVGHLDEHDPGGVFGLYLYGSSVTSGLRPDSDIDLLMLTRTALTTTERTSLTSLLLSVSGWSGHAEQLPEAADRRPVELTSLAIGEHLPWTPAPRRDFQYGEWLRAELLTGAVPHPTDDPDVITLLATAQSAHRVLRGRPLDELVAPVSREQLSTSALQSIPQLLEELTGDERNVVLTLARIVVTVKTGRIVSKVQAAQQIAPSLSVRHRELLERARAGYQGQVSDDWADDSVEVQELARELAERAEQLR